jgi:AcrR family transcriptional regulator
MTGKQRPAGGDAAVRTVGTRRAGLMTRQSWAAVGLAMLAGGRAPADVTLAELCRVAGIGKGSFYSHFSGMKEFGDAVVEQWLAGIGLEELDRQMGAVRDPADRLRLLLERALGTPGMPDAVRRLAAGSDPAADAVTGVLSAFERHVTAALGDLGLREPDTRVLGSLLLRAYVAAQPGRDEHGQLDTLLDFARRGSRVLAEWQLHAVPVTGDSAGGSGLVLYPVPADLLPEELQSLSDAVQRWVRTRDGGTGGTG